MKKDFSTYLLQHTKAIQTLLICLAVISAILSSFTWLQPANNSTNLIENDVQIMTNFDYQATYNKNILYPDGGTVEQKETMFRRIMNEIPIQLSSQIMSESPVQVEGTYDVKLVIQAGEFWEKEFQLKEKQAFKEDGNEINLIKDGNYSIQFEMIENFIVDVEEELSIRPEFYSILIYPNVEGTLTYKEATQKFLLQDPLTFQLYNEEIVLASEQQFITPLPFKATGIISNTSSIFGMKVPIATMQLTSTIITLLFILGVMIMNKTKNSQHQLTIKTEGERISQRYKRRLLPVLHKVDPEINKMIHLPSFSHVLQIADAKDLPIFYYDDLTSNGKLYFVIDEGYMYQFRLIEGDIFVNSQIDNQSETIKKDSEQTYVLEQ